MFSRLVTATRLPIMATIVFFGFASVSIHAQSINLNPGLWEYTNELSFGEGRTPQIQVFEDCVTAEDLSEGSFMMQDIDACEVVEQQTRFDRMTYVMNCLGPDGTTLAIDARIEFDGDTAQGVIKNTVATPLGDMDMVVNLSARRLGECETNNEPAEDASEGVTEPAPN